MSRRSDDDDDTHDVDLLRYQLAQEVKSFSELAALAGLPWIDKQMFRDELLRDATIVKLPPIKKLNEILRSQLSIASEIASLCAAREEMIDDMVTNYCGFGHQRIACTQQLHMDACVLLRHIDEASDRIIHLTEEWRKPAAHPLPVIYRGENYICRMAHQCSHGNCIASITSHLRSTCRFMPFFYSSSYDPVMTDANKVLRRKELHFINSEREVQLSWCQSQLLMARMGMYAPVLRFRPHAHAKSRVPSCIMIDNVKWKHQLILSYSNAFQRLAARRPAQDNIVVAAAAQLAHLLSGSLRQRYFHMWFDATLASRRKRENSIHLKSLSNRRVLSRYFVRWKKDAEGGLWTKQMVLALITKQAALIRSSFMRLWFRKTVLGRVRRQAQRAMYLDSFRAMLLLGMQSLLRRQEITSSCRFLQATMLIGQKCTNAPLSALQTVAATAVIVPVPAASQAESCPPPPQPVDEEGTTMAAVMEGPKPDSEAEEVDQAHHAQQENAIGDEVDTAIGDEEKSERVEFPRESV